MTMILLRIIVTGSWAGCFIVAARAAGSSSGDFTALGCMVVGILLSIGMSAVWTPMIADFLCGPLLSVIDDCTYVESKSRLNGWIDWASRNKYYSLLVFLCLLKGFLRPEIPTAFLKGLKHSKPGSWAQKVLARRVYRFNNTQNSLRAAKVLEEHGEKPRWHHNPEVVLSLMREEKEKLKKTQPIKVYPPAVVSDTTTQLPFLS